MLMGAIRGPVLVNLLVRLVLLLSAVEPEAMRFCFDAVMRGTLAEGAELQIIETPGAGRCIDCGATIAMQERYGLCPSCGGRMQITGGNSMRVKDMAVDDQM